jgi:hypothetical protein
MRQAGTSAGGRTATAQFCAWLFSTRSVWAEEKSRIRHLTSTEAALTASETREEVVARD